MSNYCYMVIPAKKGKYRVAKVIKNEFGYYPLGKSNPNDPNELDKFLGDYEHCKSICDFRNSKLKLDFDATIKIINSSMEAR